MEIALAAAAALLVAMGMGVFSSKDGEQLSDDQSAELSARLDESEVRQAKRQARQTVNRERERDQANPA